MTRLVVTADADADISDVLDHLAKEAGAAVALAYGRKFRLSIERLLEFPGMEHADPPLGQLPNCDRSALHPDLRLH